MTEADFYFILALLNFVLTGLTGMDIAVPVIFEDKKFSSLNIKGKIMFVLTAPMTLLIALFIGCCYLLGKLFYSKNFYKNNDLQ